MADLVTLCCAGGCIRWETKMDYRSGTCNGGRSYTWPHKKYYTRNFLQYKNVSQNRKDLHWRRWTLLIST